MSKKGTRWWYRNVWMIIMLKRKCNRNLTKYKNVQIFEFEKYKLVKQENQEGDLTDADRNV